jgi:hypothetical protein
VRSRRVTAVCPEVADFQQTATILIVGDVSLSGLVRAAARFHNQSDCG